MARRPRLNIPGLPQHIVQRGVDRRRCFFEERDYLVYLRALADAATRHGVFVHAYVLMTNHVHLLMTPMGEGGVSRLMQSLGAAYVAYINASRRRTGTLWEGRYRACLVERDRHLLAACRYIDLNPVRAGMVAHPRDYRWSSYGALAGERYDALVSPHETLAQLGTATGLAYARWCAEACDGGELERLRDATGRGLPFGTDAFKTVVESTTGRRAFQRFPGRPRRCDAV